MPALKSNVNHKCPSTMQWYPIWAPKIINCEPEPSASTFKNCSAMKDITASACFSSSASILSQWRWRPREWTPVSPILKNRKRRKELVITSNSMKTTLKILSVCFEWIESTNRLRKIVPINLIWRTQYLSSKLDAKDLLFIEPVRKCWSFGNIWSSSIKESALFLLWAMRIVTKSQLKRGLKSSWLRLRPYRK